MSNLSLIVAIAKNNVIGNQNQLPWHMPADLQHFKQLTIGKPIIMGRKTFASIGKALPGRRNIIVTHQQNFSALDCDVVHSLNEALAITNEAAEVMIIGGSQLFAETLPIANRLYLTFIHHEFVGDTFFPAWSAQDWQEVSREDFAADTKNPYPYSFVTFERV